MRHSVVALLVATCSLVLASCGGGSEPEPSLAGDTPDDQEAARELQDLIRSDLGSITTPSPDVVDNECKRYYFSQGVYNLGYIAANCPTHPAPPERLRIFVASGGPGVNGTEVDPSVSLSFSGQAFNDVAPTVCESVYRQLEQSGSEYDGPFNVYGDKNKDSYEC